MSKSRNPAYPSVEQDFAPFPSRRSAVHSTKGIVSCTQPLAARAGIKVLQEGGNAADAAVATAAALNVTEPPMTGIGGDMFCLYYDAKTKKTQALNGSGRAGANMTLEKIRGDLGFRSGQPGQIPFRSVHAVTVPGAAAGWVDTVEKFGSGKLSLEQVLKPAIDLAEEGFPVSKLSSAMWQGGESCLKDASPNFAEMLKSDENASQGCRAPRPGELFANKNLANTFRLLAKHGKKGFYEGQVAEALIDVVKSLKGHLTLDDLKHHGESGSDEVSPISLTFSGQNIAEPVELWEHPPNGQGIVALMALGMFQELEKQGKIKQFTPRDHNSVEYLHALIEVFRLAFSDASMYVADPDVSSVPAAELISERYLAQRCSKFDPKSAIRTVDPGSPSAFSSDTVYLATADAHGNACSLINSNYGGFGTGIVPEGCGFTLQNRGANFTLGGGAVPPTHANILAPRKRPYHTIIPGMVTRPAAGGALHSCFGVMGGFMQPQGHVQVLLNMEVFGMDPQTALDAPRVCIEEIAADGVSDAGVDRVFVEDGVPRQVIDGLRKLGHEPHVLGGWGREKFGRGQVIRWSEEDGKGVWSAGSDPRGDGQAAPL